MLRLRPNKRKTNKSSTLSSTITTSNDSHNDIISNPTPLSLTTSIGIGPTMHHSSAFTHDDSDPRQPLLGTTVAGIAGANPDTISLNNNDAKIRIVNGQSYDAITTRLSQPHSQSSSFSQHTITSNEGITEGSEEEDTMDNISRKSQWILLAVASGACAAFNGVFAKLTTTQLTTSFAENVAGFFGLGEGEKVVEYIVRGTFFLLNLIFNGVMWTLFTKALARGTSTVQVSIINTSSNFMITAVLGFIIFSESLPPLWFLGAAMLVAGNVIIGRREEEEKASGDLEGGERRGQEEGEGLLGEELELGGSVISEGEDAERKSLREEQDVLDLGLDEEDGKSDDDELLLR